MNSLSEQFKVEEGIIEEKIEAIKQRKEEITPDEKQVKEVAFDIDQTGLRWAAMQVAGLNSMTGFLTAALGISEEKAKADISKVLSMFNTLDSTPIIQNMESVHVYSFRNTYQLILEKTQGGDLKLSDEMTDHPEIMEAFREGSQQLVDLVLGGKEAYSRARDERFGLYHTFAFTLEKLKDSGKKLYGVSDSHIGKLLRRLRMAGIDHLFDLVLAQSDPNRLPHYAEQRATRGAFNVDCKYGELPHIKPDINFAEQLILNGIKKGTVKEDGTVDNEDVERVAKTLASFCVMVGDNVTKDGGFSLHNRMRYFKAAFGHISTELQKELGEFGNEAARSRNMDVENEKTVEIIRETRMKVLKFPTDLLAYLGIDFDVDELHEFELQRMRDEHDKKKTRSLWKSRA